MALTAQQQNWMSHMMAVMSTALALNEEARALTAEETLNGFYANGLQEITDPNIQAVDGSGNYLYPGLIHITVAELTAAMAGLAAVTTAFGLPYAVGGTPPGNAAAMLKMKG